MSTTGIYSLQNRMVNSVAKIFAIVHDTVVQYSKRMAVEMKRYCYVTPTNFLELVVGYKKFKLQLTFYHVTIFFVHIY